MSRRRARGFTLIELMVSLTAGLIVAIAVAGLAKVATTTFYEESRVQVAELSLRIAVDRLRSDLQRAAYMSTSNVLTDPLMVLPAGQASYVVPAQFANGLGLLAGVRYLPDSSFAGDDPNNQIATMSTANLGAIPDRLILGGNMTTADEYIVQSILSGGGCGGSTVTLSLDSPAISRLVRDAAGALLPTATAEAALTAAFAPVATVGVQSPWMARIVDDSGKRQFVALCAARPVEMVSGAPTIYTQLATPVLSAQATGAQGGTTGFGVGRLTINPVQLVEWSVRDRSAETASITQNWAKDTGPDAGTKFDLMRQYLDATGTRVGTPELVAEYIVDFEIGLVLQNPIAGATPRMQVAPFDATSNPLVTQNSTPTLAPATGPQWIRSLRYRMATRAPMADREVDIARPAGTGYAYRYCTIAGGVCTPANSRFARVRTLTGEVTLQNQTRFP